MRSSREVRRRTVQGTFRLCLTVNNRRSGIVKKHGRLFFLLIIWLCYMFFRANPLDVRASLIDPKTLVPIYILGKKEKIIVQQLPKCSPNFPAREKSLIHGANIRRRGSSQAVWLPPFPRVKFPLRLHRSLFPRPRMRFRSCHHQSSVLSTPSISHASVHGAQLNALLNASAKRPTSSMSSGESPPDFSLATSTLNPFMEAIDFEV